MTRRIVVTVASDGTITAQSTGQPGPACLDDVGLIEQLCPHARTVDSRLTDEYYTTATTDVTDTAFVREGDQP